MNANCGKESIRPPRVLISLIDQLPYSMITEISARSTSLKRNIKIPMVLLIWSTATFSGLNVCLLKCFGEILAVNDFWTMPFMVSSLIVAIICGAILQIIILNMALRYYNNLDVIPVYQSLILTMLLVCGWVLLNEV